MTKIRAVFVAVLGFALTACGEADIPVEPTPPPPPTAGVVVLGVTPSVVAGLTCTIGSGTTSAQIVPMQPYTTSPGTFAIKCNAPGYEEGTDPVVIVEAGRTTPAKVTMVKSPTPPPPAPTTATGIIGANILPANVDSVWEYSLSGEKTTSIVNKPAPYIATVEVSKFYLYWLSAKGYYPEPLQLAPEAGKPFDRMATLRPISPPPPTPPTTGWLRVVPMPQGMRVEVTHVRSGKKVAAVTGEVLGEWDAGFYTVDCFDPSGKHNSVTIHTDIDPGEYKTEVCILPEKKPDDPPPVPKMYKLIVNSTPILGVGVTITKYGNGTSVATGTTRMERTLETDIYVVSCAMPGYLSYSEVVILNEDRTVNCLMWKEVEIPPPPPPPTVGILILTDDIEGPVEMRLYKVVNGERTFVHDYITDKVLVNMMPGEYIGVCVKPGSNGRVVGDGRVMLVAGKITTLRCKMEEVGSS